jgi:hypothetical protein
MLASRRFNIDEETHVATELAAKIAVATGHIDKEADIAWALKELLGNIRHAPSKIGYVEVDDCGNLTLTNCACSKGTTQAEKHGMGFGIARSLGAIIDLSFVERDYGCWQAITHIGWDFVAEQHIEFNLDSIE